MALGKVVCSFGYALLLLCWMFIVHLGSSWSWSYDSSNATRCELVSDLRQVDGFLRFPPPIELNATILLKYYWKWR